MVKVEMETRQGPDGEIITLAFECNKPEEYDVIDAIRVAMFGDHKKRGGYANSNRLIVEINSEPQ